MKSINNNYNRKPRIHDIYKSQFLYSYNTLLLVPGRAGETSMLHMKNLSKQSTRCQPKMYVTGSRRRLQPNKVYIFLISNPCSPVLLSDYQKNMKKCKKPNSKRHFNVRQFYFL